MPDAALQCQRPAFHRVGLIAAVFQQGIDAVPIGNELHAHAVALWEPWNGGLLAKGKQCHRDSTGVAHAGGNAVDGEQGTAQELAAAVSPAVAVTRNRNFSNFDKACFLGCLSDPTYFLCL